MLENETIRVNLSSATACKLWNGRNATGDKKFIRGIRHFENKLMEYDERNRQKRDNIEAKLSIIKERISVAFSDLITQEKISRNHIDISISRSRKDESKSLDFSQTEALALGLLIGALDRIICRWQKIELTSGLLSDNKTKRPYQELSQINKMIRSLISEA